MGNSLLIAALTVCLTLALSAMAAFVLRPCAASSARHYLLNYFLIGLMFPAATAILPLFIRIRDLGLLDTYWGVVLPQVAFGLGHVASCCSATTSATCPRELFDAAFVDGCGYMRLLLVHDAAACRGRSWPRSASSPSSSVWNSYILPLIMLNSESRIPGPWASWSIAASSRPIGSWCWRSSR